MIYTPYLWPKLLAAVIPLGLALYMRRFRAVPAALPFSRLMGVTALWALFHALNSITISLPLRLWWGHLQIIPTVMLAPASLSLALAYSGDAHRLTRRRWLWLLAIPLGVVLLEWTGAYHTLYRYNFSMDLSGATPTLHYTSGIGFWIHTGYMYFLLLIACGRLITAFPPLTPYFWNANVITFCLIFPFIVSFLYERGITPIPGYNFSSTTFIFTGPLQLWAILRFRMFELIPVARQTMLEQMQEGMLVVDAQQRIVDVNAAAIAILGAASHAARIGTRLTPTPDLAGLYALIHAPTPSPTVQYSELDIAQRRYQVSSAPLRDRREGQSGYLIILHDITALQQAQARSIEQQRALAMMEERVRLARELHDGLGQVLGYVKLRAQIARDLLAQGEMTEADAYLANLIAVTQDAHTDIREYLMGVRATTTPETAFHRVLEQYLAQFSRNYGIHTELTAADIPGNLLSPTAEVQLLRIIQEALSNTRKYAHATQVQISLTLQADQLHVIIQDNGQGFDPAQPTTSGPTFGLRFMRERAKELRGNLDVQSAPGQGTRVCVTVPTQM